MNILCVYMEYLCAWIYWMLVAYKIGFLLIKAHVYKRHKTSQHNSMMHSGFTLPFAKGIPTLVFICISILWYLLSDSQVADIVLDIEEDVHKFKIVPSHSKRYCLIRSPCVKKFNSSARL